MSTSSISCKTHPDCNCAISQPSYMRPKGNYRIICRREVGPKPSSWHVKVLKYDCHDHELGRGEAKRCRSYSYVHSGSHTLILGERSRTGRVRSTRSDSVREEPVRTRSRLGHIDPRMPRLEGHIHLPFLVVDQTEPSEFRKNPHVHPTFKIFPLGAPPRKRRRQHLLDDLFLLVAPHIHRIKSLTIYADALPDVLRYFSHRAPLLEELDINLTSPRAPVGSALFGGDLSSLRRLGLSGVITLLPWKNLASLTTFILKSCRPGHDFVTRLLDFFESAPLLRTLMLEDSILKSSNAPPGRILLLPHPNILAITAKPAHSVLLILEFSFGGERYPLQDCLPETFASLRNLSHTTMVNLISLRPRSLCSWVDQVGGSASSWPGRTCAGEGV